MSYQKRPDKFDKLTNHRASRADDLSHHIIGPFDARSGLADRKWGIGRLAELVSPDTALTWAKTMANLNEAIRACYEPEDENQALANLKACVASGIKGFDYMDAEAERTGQPKADVRCWEYELGGVKVGIMADVDAWPALKAARPDLRLFGLHEVAVALLAVDSSPAVAAIKDRFPGAKVGRIKPNPPVAYATGGDPIPF
jgi:hypothetical protein